MWRSRTQQRGKPTTTKLAQLLKFYAYMISVITDALHSHSAPGPGNSLRIKDLSLNEIGV
jgi:hypothetical protein